MKRKYRRTNRVLLINLFFIRLNCEMAERKLIQTAVNRNEMKIQQLENVIGKRKKEMSPLTNIVTKINILDSYGSFIVLYYYRILLNNNHTNIQNKIILFSATTTTIYQSFVQIINRLKLLLSK